MLNCASQEYFGAIDLKKLAGTVITPVFLENKNGSNKIVSFFEKRARGAMARFVIENHLKDPRDLESFNSGGYKFQKALSDKQKLVFVLD